MSSGRVPTTVRSFIALGQGAERRGRPGHRRVDEVGLRQQRTQLVARHHRVGEENSPSSAGISSPCRSGSNGRMT